jgi:hypothetical protein
VHGHRSVVSLIPSHAHVQVSGSASGNDDEFVCINKESTTAGTASLLPAPPTAVGSTDDRRDNSGRHLGMCAVCDMLSLVDMFRLCLACSGTQATHGLPLLYRCLNCCLAGDTPPLQQPSP